MTIESLNAHVNAIQHGSSSKHGSGTKINIFFSIHAVKTMLDRIQIFESGARLYLQFISILLQSNLYRKLAG